MSNNKKSSQSSGKTLYIFGVIFSALVLFVYLINGVVEQGWILRSLDNKWSDFRMSLPNNIGTSEDADIDYISNIGKYYNHRADDRIFIAAIDEHTVAKLGYPFKRKHYATLINRLSALGVAALGIDVTLTDPDRDDPASDRRMAEAVRKAGNVVNLVYESPQRQELLTPFSGLGESSKYMAHPHVETNQEGNGQVRRVSLFSAKYLYNDLKIKTRCGKDCEGVGLPLLAAATYATAENIPLYELDLRYGSEPKLINFRVPMHRPHHPGWKDKDSGMHDSVYRHISVLDIMEGRLSKEEKEIIKGGIALLGSTAMGAFDHYPSPFYTSWPGVEVHANLIDNMLHNDFLKPFPGVITVLLALFVIWLPILLSKHSIKVISLSSAGVIALILPLNFIMLANHYDMPFLSILVIMLVPFVFVTVHKAMMEGREKKWIKNTFGQYLSPKVVELVTKDPSKLSLGGEKRDMTAFFLDLAGFTTMSEKLSPEELTAMLVEYLSAFTDVIMKHDGTVDKYIGDCVVAFWNAPMDQPDHRKLGVLAAIDCQTAMTRLNESLTQFTIKPSCRVGVNSGPMVVGNMGSKQRLSYTVMGDSVNMASRMEGANKFFHSKIMTSEQTFGDIKDYFDYRYLGSIRVVGKAIPTRVYEPFARKGEAAAEVKAMLQHYNEGQEKFYAGDFKGAVPHFKAALEAKPGDGPAEFYLQKAELFAKEPIKDWDQSFNLTEKG